MSGEEWAADNVPDDNLVALSAAESVYQSHSEYAQQRHIAAKSGSHYICRGVEARKQHGEHRQQRGDHKSKAGYNKENPAKEHTDYFNARVSNRGPGRTHLPEHKH